MNCYKEVTLVCVSAVHIQNLFAFQPLRLLCECGWRDGRDKGEVGRGGFRGKSKGEEGVKRGLLRVTEVEAWRRPTH